MEDTFEPLSRQRHRIRVDGAASLGDLGFIQYLHHLGYRFTTRAMDDAAASGCLAVVRWIYDHHRVLQLKLLQPFSGAWPRLHWIDGSVYDGPSLRCSIRHRCPRRHSRR